MLSIARTGSKTCDHSPPSQDFNQRHDAVQHQYSLKLQGAVQATPILLSGNDHSANIRMDHSKTIHITLNSMIRTLATCFAASLVTTSANSSRPKSQLLFRHSCPWWLRLSPQQHRECRKLHAICCIRSRKNSIQPTKESYKFWLRLQINNQHHRASNTK